MAKARNYQIPPRPPLIAEAERRLREATAAREDAQARHREAARRYHKQKPGEPATIVIAEVDALAEQIQPAIDAEREAESALKRARAEYRATVKEALQGPVEALERDLIATVQRLESLMAEGAEVAAKARKAGVSLPSRVPEACALSGGVILPLIRDFLRQGGVHV